MVGYSHFPPLYEGLFDISFFVVEQFRSSDVFQYGVVCFLPFPYMEVSFAFFSYTDGSVSDSYRCEVFLWVSLGHVPYLAVLFRQIVF